MHTVFKIITDKVCIHIYSVNFKDRLSIPKQNKLTACYKVRIMLFNMIVNLQFFSSYLTLSILKYYNQLIDFFCFFFVY